MRLNVLTAVSRPQNLGRVAESLAVAAERAPSVKVAWRWKFDTGRQHIGGQAVKNALIEQVPASEWFWCLDDDTLAHEDVLLTAGAFTYGYDAIIVSQLRSDGRVLAAHPQNVQVGSIDIGQAFLRRDLVGSHRIPEDYNGDGMFLAAVLSEASDVMYHPAALSLHNAISQVEVGV